MQTSVSMKEERNGGKKGKMEEIFSTAPSSSHFTTDREAFDAVMKNDGCNAQGSLGLRD